MTYVVIKHLATTGESSIAGHFEDKGEAETFARNCNSRALLEIWYDILEIEND